MVQEDQENNRKGPWTKEEDVQLALYVNLFGDRRWDFIAKVSGLKRTGKSCRLRWVNYLHPGLRRGKMTPQEERLVLELHSKWGNRWSKIARKLPGRTDNEVKNYWRTQMRKKAHEKKKAKAISSSSSSSLSSISSSSSTKNPAVNSMPISETNNQEIKESVKVYSMDEIWKDIELSEDEIIKKSFSDEVSCTMMASPIWDYFPDTLWKIDDNFMHIDDDVRYLRKL